MARKRSKQVITRLTEEEYQEYEKLLGVSKLKKNEYGIKCLLNKKITVMEGFKDFADQVKKVGVNLNQITRAINYGQLLEGREELDQMQKELGEVWRLLSAFLQKVR